MDSEKLYMGTRQAAAVAGVHQRTVNRWIEEGKLHAERAFEGGPWLIEWDDIESRTRPVDRDEPECA